MARFQLHVQISDFSRKTEVLDTVGLHFNMATLDWMAQCRPHSEGMCALQLAAAPFQLASLTYVMCLAPQAFEFTTSLLWGLCYKQL